MEKLTTIPTPIFNTPHITDLFSFTKNSTLFDEKCLTRALEFIALKDTHALVEHHSKNVVAITIESYPSNKQLYADLRYFTNSPSSTSLKKTPSKQEILKRLNNFPKSLYLWGGNCSGGVFLQKDLYPIEKRSLSPFEWKNLILQGVDCSGLLYEVSGGSTPRNTSDLLSYGTPITKDQIVPLDIVVWRGHMFIILDNRRCIESEELEGIHYTPLRERFNRLERTKSWSSKITSDSQYTIRRIF